MEFAYAGGGLGKGGKVTLYTDGKKVGEGDIAATLAMVFSADDGCDVGEDSGRSGFGGLRLPRQRASTARVKGVQIAIAEAAENSDHLVIAGGGRPHRDGAAVGVAATNSPAMPFIHQPSRYNRHRRESAMKRRTGWLIAVPVVLAAGIAFAQYPIMNMVADKVVQKYQTSTCEQLWANKGKHGPEEARMVGLLKNDPQMRQAFFDRIAGPVMNKMFECGMIP